MFVPDLPAVAAGYTPVMVAQAASVGQGSSRERVLGVCQPVPNRSTDDVTGEHGVFPVPAAVHYLWTYENKRGINESGAKVTILEGPQHGKMVDEGGGDFQYLPNAGYFGKDRVVALVDIAGYRVKVIFFLQAVNRGLGNYWEQELCGKKGATWKISSAPEVVRELVDFEVLRSVPDVTLSSASLANGAAGGGV